jgi:hypothetical protein
LPWSTCPALPESGCYAGAKAKFQLKDRAGADRDQVKWKWSNGDYFTFFDLGDPLTTTAYRVCVYDESATSPRLAFSLDLEPGGSWTSRAGRGWYYKDRDASADGVGKLQIAAPVGGRPKITLSAKGGGVPLPGPWATERYFEQAPNLTVQLVAQSPFVAPSCWTARFDGSNTRANDGQGFKATAP